jgi:hypothetical protein
MAKKKPSSSVQLLEIETRFAKMARREGGVPKSEAVIRAQAEIDKIKPGFYKWLDGEIEEFAGLINHAPSAKADPEWIEHASFCSREVRDSATTFGFELIAFIAGSLCELLDAMATGSECDIEAVICHVDALVLARKKSYRDLKPDQVPDLTKGLRRVVRHVAP